MEMQELVELVWLESRLEAGHRLSTEDALVLEDLRERFKTARMIAGSQVALESGWRQLTIFGEDD